MEPSTTQLFFHNPVTYGDYLAEMGESQVSITQRYWGDFRGDQAKMSDPVRWMRRTFGQMPWTLLYIEHDVAAFYDQRAQTVNSRPVAAWPVFNFFTQRIDELTYLLENPWGQSRQHLGADVPVRRRPVKDQPNRVYITGLPRNTSPEFGSLSAFLRWAKSTYDVEFIIHSDHSFANAMNMGAWGATYNLQAPLAGGCTITQYGTEVRFTDRAQMEAHEGAFNEVGFEIDDLYLPPGSEPTRQVYNEQRKYGIAAARFAAYYWHHRGTPGPGNHRSTRPDVSGEGTLDDFVAQVVQKKLHSERGQRATR